VLDDIRWYATRGFADEQSLWLIGHCRRRFRNFKCYGCDRSRILLFTKCGSVFKSGDENCRPSLFEFRLLPYGPAGSWSPTRASRWYAISFLGELTLFRKNVLVDKDGIARLGSSRAVQRDSQEPRDAVIRRAEFVPRTVGINTTFVSYLLPLALSFAPLPSVLLLSPPLLLHLPFVLHFLAFLSYFLTSQHHTARIAALVALQDTPILGYRTPRPSKKFSRSLRPRRPRESPRESHRIVAWILTLGA